MTESATAEVKKRASPQQQPVEAASVPGAILRLSTVITVTGLSKGTIYRAMKANTFPPSTRLSPNCIGWNQADIVEWKNGRRAWGDES